MAKKRYQVEVTRTIKEMGVIEMELEDETGWISDYDALVKVEKAEAGRDDFGWKRLTTRVVISDTRRLYTPAELEARAARDAKRDAEAALGES